MKTIPVPLDWLQRVSKLLDDVRDRKPHVVPESGCIPCRARTLGSELVKIVADAQKEKKP